MNKQLPHSSNADRKKIVKDLNVKASFLFVTRNRCPSKYFEKNPLTWAFETLFSNFASDKITEWLVLDDGSSDYTQKNIVWLSEKYQIKIRFKHYSERKGCSFRRRQGIEMLSNDLFFMGDDDCLYREDFINKSLFTWQELSKKDAKISVLAVPVVEMRTTFDGKIEKKHVGSNDLENAYFCHNFNKRVVANSVAVRRVFKIHMFKGITLGSRAAFLSAGSFLDLSFWDNDYSEHLEVAYNLDRMGYAIYYLPDILASVTHIKWGCSRKTLPDSEKNIIFKGTSYNLSQIEKLSIKASRSGCRVDDRKFIINRIGSFLAFYLKVNLESASRYAVTEYENIVNNKRIIDIFLEVEKLPIEARMTLWQNGICLGMQFAQNITGLSYKLWYDQLMRRIKNL